MNAIEQAIQKAGGASVLQKSLGVSTVQVVWNWTKRGVPEEYCPAIERDTGVPVEALRPDIPWHRVPDHGWPNPLGRPTIDYAASRSQEKETA